LSFYTELKRRNVFRVAVVYTLVAWVVLQVAETLGPALHLPEWLDSAVAFLLILGFPIAIVFAWAFELTPDGIKKEKDVDRSKSIAHATGQKLNTVIIGVLVLALAYFAIDKFVLQPRSKAGSSTAIQAPVQGQESIEQSIAVLPFVDMSANSDNEYFSDGLSEELLNILAKIKELRVAGRTSSFAFRGKDEDLRSIGGKLNVATILEGSVRKDDKRNRVRITAQLVNVEDGYHLWSETYDRDLDDIFAIQDEIAHKVVQALRITLLGEDGERLEQVIDTDINAYDLYLKGLRNLNIAGYISLDKAVAQFQEALTRDPAYVPAKIGLVTAWTQMATTGSISYQQAISRGLPLLEQVLEEHPHNSAAQIQMAILKVFEGENEAAEEAFLAALDVDPRNALGLKHYGRFLFDNGRVEQGMKLIDSAVEIEPYSVLVLWEQCQTNAYLQRVEKALAVCERINDLAPESPMGWYGWALAYSFSGDMAHATKGFIEAVELDPGDFEMIAAVSFYWLTMGDENQAQSWLQRAEAIGAGQPFPIIARLRILKQREQHDQVRDLAGKTLAQNAEDRHGSQRILRQIWAYELARIGDFEGALVPFHESISWAFEPELVVPANLAGYTDDVIQIAALLKLADPTSERSAQLLEVVEGLTADLPPEWGPWTGYQHQAAIATIRGEYETALQWLDRAWDNKWRYMWHETLIEDVVFSQLKNEPGYKNLVARFELDMDQQRQLAHELLGIEKEE